MAARSVWVRIAGAAVRTLTASARRAGKVSSAPPPRRVGSGPGDAPSSAGRTAYPGDFHGTVRAQYAPVLDGDPDPGEIVWTWVPYEEDRSRGKDRPVLIVGRDGPWLLGLMLTSKDHSRERVDEARRGRRWIDVGSGVWDARRRPSEIRLDRVLRVDPQAMRREGAVMDRVTFERVAAGLRSRPGW